MPQYADYVVLRDDLAGAIAGADEGIEMLSSKKAPGYDYDERWFCDKDTTKDCPSGWPGWRWDQARAASLGRAYNYAHVSSSYLGVCTAVANQNREILSTV